MVQAIYTLKNDFFILWDLVNLQQIRANFNQHISDKFYFMVNFDKSSGFSSQIYQMEVIVQLDYLGVLILYGHLIALNLIYGAPSDF